MWEHPTPEKRWFSTKYNMAGFWRECVVCARGSTDLDDDPNYVEMHLVGKKSRLLRKVQDFKGQVYDNYWVVCKPCYERLSQ